MHPQQVPRHATLNADRISRQFAPEAASFYSVESLNLHAQNITIPGLSPLFPDAHCSPSGEVCQITMGESGKCSFRSVFINMQSNRDVQK